MKSRKKNFKQDINQPTLTQILPEWHRVSNKRKRSEEVEEVENKSDVQQNQEVEKKQKVIKGSHSLNPSLNIENVTNVSYLLQGPTALANFKWKGRPNGNYSTQMEGSASESVANAPTQMDKNASESVANAPTQMDVDASDSVANAPTQMDVDASDSVANAPTQMDKNASDSVASAPTQMDKNASEPVTNTPTHIEDNNEDDCNDLPHIEIYEKPVSDFGENFIPESPEVDLYKTYYPFEFSDEEQLDEKYLEKESEQTKLNTPPNPRIFIDLEKQEMELKSRITKLVEDNFKVSVVGYMFLFPLEIREKNDKPVKKNNHPLDLTGKQIEINGIIKFYNFANILYKAFENNKVPDGEFGSKCQYIFKVFKDPSIVFPSEDVFTVKNYIYETIKAIMEKKFKEVIPTEREILERKGEKPTFISRAVLTEEGKDKHDGSKFAFNKSKPITLQHGNGLSFMRKGTQSTTLANIENNLPSNQASGFKPQRVTYVDRLNSKGDNKENAICI